MKIGVDISQIVYEGTGVSRFTQGLVDSILEYEKKNEWVFFFSSLRRSLKKDTAEAISRRGFKLLQLPIPPTALSFLWNTMHIARFENFVGRVDWIIASDWTQPPSHAKRATIVHDLAFMKVPETVDEKIRRTQETRLGWVARECDVIFADSQATKNDLVELFKMNEKKVIVNYPGVEISQPSLAEIKAAKIKYKLDKPFILTVGKVEPRKNLDRLIEAFNRLQAENAELVIAGPEGWGKEYEKQKNIRILGYVTDEELAALYYSCLGFVYPSLWEGFGYPVIEAMALGAPVATSKTSSLGEIVGEAALLFDPLKVEEIVQCVERLISDENVRNDLIKKGRERAKQFTWEKYYQKLIGALENS